jgi:hypothetical protein
MSETVAPPQIPIIDSASGAAPGAAPLLAPVGEPPQVAANAPVLALPPGLAPETHAVLELIARGLSPEAEDATRTTARDLWARFAQTIATAAPAPQVPPAPPIPPAAPVPPVVPAIPEMPMPPMPPMPTSSIAMGARALRQLPPDQLLDLLLTRLRAVLPQGATVPTPKGIQFQLIPVTPPPSAR